MSLWEWSFALLGMACVLIPLGLEALGYRVPRPIAIMSVMVGVGELDWRVRGTGLQSLVRAAYLRLLRRE